ncbi:MAG TPA: phosphatase PAP2 family protein [Ktedonobacteraceae bacterium]|nr:phosphatase PAP2 family protein [Ktedonobacteraceae bacterium]
MTDPLAMNANQPVLDDVELLDVPAIDLPLAMSKPRHVSFARHVSNILSPAAISFPMILLVALYKASSVVSALGYTAIALFFLSIGPFAYICLGVRLGKLSDVDVSKRSERVGPFIFGLFSICLGWFVLLLLHGPSPLITVLTITTISGLAMLIITLWWKISIHASSLAGAVTMLTALYGAIMLPTFALLVLVGWSRVVLRRHTPLQVIAGSLLGITLSAVILKLHGW